MSSWCSGQPLAAASSSNTLTKTVLATGEQVSKKSSLSLCVYPLTTSLTLYLSTEPSELSLILYTHLQAMGVLPGGKGVRTQIFFFSEGHKSPYPLPSRILNSLEEMLRLFSIRADGH